MILFLVILVLLVLIGVVGTIRDVVRDGYGRRPTLCPDALARDRHPIA